MQSKEFEKQHEDRWAAYEAALESLEKNSKKQLDVEDVSQLPSMFREVCTDLSLARHRMYGVLLNERLNALVIRGHKLINRRAGGTFGKMLCFLTAGFPRAVRKEWRLLIVATLSFVLPLVGMLCAGFLSPNLSWIQAVLGAEMMGQLDSMYGGSGDVLEHARSEYGSNFMMFCHYVMNNIGIDFRIYAGGILACLGTLFFLIFNGVFFGAVIVYIHLACNKEAFYTFVAGHSSFELIAMIIAGMAGLRIGLGFLNPGRNTRARALMEAGKRSLPLIFGAAGMTFIAALIEGFWSAQPFSPTVKYTVGITLWVAVISYFAFAGLRRKGEGART